MATLILLAIQLIILLRVASWPTCWPSNWSFGAGWSGGRVAILLAIQLIILRRVAGWPTCWLSNWSFQPRWSGGQLTILLVNRSFWAGWPGGHLAVKWTRWIIKRGQLARDHMSHFEQGGRWPTCWLSIKSDESFWVGRPRGYVTNFLEIQSMGWIILRCRVVGWPRRGSEACHLNIAPEMLGCSFGMVNCEPEFRKARFNNLNIAPEVLGGCFGMLQIGKKEQYKLIRCFFVNRFIHSIVDHNSKQPPSTSGAIFKYPSSLSCASDGDATDCCCCFRHHRRRLRHHSKAHCVF